MQSPKNFFSPFGPQFGLKNKKGGGGGRAPPLDPPLEGNGQNLRWLNTVLAVSEYRSFAKLWQEKGCSSQAETWQVKNILMKEFD